MAFKAPLPLVGLIEVPKNCLIKCFVLDGFSDSFSINTIFQGLFLWDKESTKVIHLNRTNEKEAKYEGW